jgi:putative photosynthetic complex assembly protein
MRGLPLAMGLLTVAAVAAASVGRASHFDAGAPPTLATVAARDLVFSDGPGGEVVVADAATGGRVGVYEGQQGFLRGTLRGFARARRMDAMGAAAPFRLTRWSDGRLTLDDAKTGRHVELLAFGQDNAAVFARMLYARETMP